MGKEEQDVIASFLVGNEVSSMLNKIRTGTNTPMRIMLITKNFDKDFSSIEGSVDRNNLKISLLKENDNHKLWSLEIEGLSGEQEKVKCPHCKKDFTLDSEDKFKIVNYLVEFKGNNLLILMSNDKDSFDGVVGFFNYLYPLIGRVFYKAADLRFILNKINDLPSVEVIGRNCVVKRLYDDKKTIVTYKEDTVEGFYDRAKKENGWIDSLEVFVKPLSVIGFSRKGTILYSKPFNFAGFFEIIVNTIVKDLLIARRKELKGKSRTKDSPEIRPIKIIFDSDYFSDKNNIEKLVKRLNDADKYEISVLYLSEGLAHIEVYDYANGGGFDIYINANNELNIVPQTQANELVLEGAILKISDIFEGVIK